MRRHAAQRVIRVDVRVLLDVYDVAVVWSQREELMRIKSEELREARTVVADASRRAVTVTAGSVRVVLMVRSISIQGAGRRG